jgi:ribosomal subunit interface protein
MIEWIQGFLKAKTSRTSHPMLNISIKGLHMPLTDALTDYIHDKLSSLEKFIHPHAHVAVEIGRPSKHHKKGDDIYLAEITVDSQGNTYFIQTTEGELLAAIDRARDEMVELIKAGKGKKHTLLKKGRMMLKQLTKKGFYGWND